MCYIIVLISHYTGLSILEPILEDIDDPFAVYVGMIVFGAVMTAIVILLLRLDWERILGRVAPWTLNDDEGDTT